MLSPFYENFIQKILSVPNLSDAQKEQLAILLKASKNALRCVQSKDYIFQFPSVVSTDYRQVVTAPGTYFIGTKIGVLDSITSTYADNTAAYLRDEGSAGFNLGAGSLNGNNAPLERLSLIQTHAGQYSEPKEFLYYWKERAVIGCHVQNLGAARPLSVIVSGIEIYFKELQ